MKMPPIFRIKLVIELSVIADNKTVSTTIDDLLKNIWHIANCTDFATYYHYIINVNWADYEKKRIQYLGEGMCKKNIIKHLIINLNIQEESLEIENKVKDADKTEIAYKIMNKILEMSTDNINIKVEKRR